MASPKQIDANRRNAAKGKGPKTAEGKLKSRTNALRFGLYAKMILLPGEDEAEYLRLLEAHFALRKPRDLIEVQIVREMANIAWRRARLDQAEQAYLSDWTHREAARREFKPEPNGEAGTGRSDHALIVHGANDNDRAEIRAAIDQELLTKGLEIAPDARDLREALKRAFTEPGPMQVMAHFDYMRRSLARSMQHAEDSLEAWRDRGTTIEG